MAESKQEEITKKKKKTKTHTQKKLPKTQQSSTSPKHNLRALSSPLLPSWWDTSGGHRKPSEVKTAKITTKAVVLGQLGLRTAAVWRCRRVLEAPCDGRGEGPPASTKGSHSGGDPVVHRFVRKSEQLRPCCGAERCRAGISKPWQQSAQAARACSALRDRQRRACVRRLPALTEHRRSTQSWEMNNNTPKNKTKQNTAQTVIKSPFHSSSLNFLLGATLLLPAGELK